MTTFETIFMVVYASAAIIWGCKLGVDIVCSDKKPRWEDIISLTIIVNLVIFLLAKFA